jgi:hypothetical protein
VKNEIVNERPTAWNGAAPPIKLSSLKGIFDVGKSRWLLRGAAMTALILPAALMLGPTASNASALPSANFAAQARAAPHLSAPQQATLPGSGWNSYGSFANNQTFGTQAYTANYGQVLDTIAPSDPGVGPFAISAYNWFPVWYVMACLD